MPLNTFERKALELAQNSSLMASVARSGRKIANIEFFAYTLKLPTTGTLAAGASTQGRIQFQSNSDFVIGYMSGLCEGTDVVEVQITEGGSGKTFFNAPTLVPLVFGTAGFPFVLPSPKVIEPSTNLVVDITNVDAATVMTRANFQFAGARIYYAD